MTEIPKHFNYPNRAQLRAMYRNRKIKALDFRSFKALVIADIDIKNKKYEESKKHIESKDMPNATADKQ